MGYHGYITVYHGIPIYLQKTLLFIGNMFFQPGGYPRSWWHQDPHGFSLVRCSEERRWLTGNTRRQPKRSAGKNRQRYRASVVLRRFQVIPSGYELNLFEKKWYARPDPGFSIVLHYVTMKSLVFMDILEVVTYHQPPSTGIQVVVLCLYGRKCQWCWYAMQTWLQLSQNVNKSQRSNWIGIEILWPLC